MKVTLEQVNEINRQMEDIEGAYLMERGWAYVPEAGILWWTKPLPDGRVIMAKTRHDAMSIECKR